MYFTTFQIIILVVTSTTLTEDHSQSHLFSPVSAEVDNATSTVSVTQPSVPTSSTSHLASSRIISYTMPFRLTHNTPSPVNLQLNSMEKYRRGLGSTLLARCNKRNKEIVFKTCNKVELKTPEGTIRSTYEANAAAVMGQMSVGGGHRNLEEVMCTTGVPSIFKPTFIDIRISF